MSDATKPAPTTPEVIEVKDRGMNVILWRDGSLTFYKPGPNVDPDVARRMRGPDACIMFAGTRQLLAAARKASDAEEAIGTAIEQLETHDDEEALRTLQEWAEEAEKEDLASFADDDLKAKAKQARLVEA